MVLGERGERIRSWLEERLALGGIREFIAHKTVPIHSATIWYYFGGITLFLFVRWHQFAAKWGSTSERFLSMIRQLTHAHILLRE